MAPQHDWLEKDYYKVLGVAKDVAAQDLNKAYRKLARKYHPDANPDDPKAEDKFKELSEAYSVLNDPEKRKEYDEVRALGASGLGGFGPGRGPGAAGGGGFSFDTSDISDLLGGMFGGGGGRRRERGAAPGHGPAKGADLEAELHLDFEDAVYGVTTSVHLVSDASCGACGGSGAAKGTRPQTCTQCRGRGVVDENQGFFSLSQPCDRCGGRGQVITSPCGNCRGTGTERKPRQIKVRIPAGVDDGQKIKLKGRGSPGRNGGPAGDLYVVVKVGSHQLFTRQGKNLRLDLPLTFAEAALGANVKVPTLDGSTVTLKIPPGTAHGRTFRVKNRGIATAKATGDLLASVVIDVPSKLTEPQRKAVEALSNATLKSPRAHLYDETE